MPSTRGKTAAAAADAIPQQYSMAANTSSMSISSPWPKHEPRQANADSTASAAVVHSRSASMDHLQQQHHQHDTQQAVASNQTTAATSTPARNDVHLQHKHSASLGQMGNIAASAAPAQHQPRNHYAALRMGFSSPMADGFEQAANTHSMDTRSSSTVPGRTSHTGTTPNLANLAIYTTQNGSAFVRSLSQQQQHAHQYGNNSVRSASPSTSSIASTSWTPPSTYNAAATGSNLSPLTSIDSRFSGGAPSMDSRDASMDGYSNSASISRASSASGAPDVSMSLSSSSNGTPGIGINVATRQKHKSKLLNIDRKRICMQHLRNPKLKQDELAQIFGIERSTVSKVLKEQERWLAIVDESEDAFVTKHRNPRFPELEEHLASWAKHAQAAGQTLTDSTIRKKALEIAERLPPDSSAKKFKASGGWVEKFRTRAGLRKSSSSGGSSNNGSAIVVRASPTQHQAIDGVLAAGDGMDCGLLSPRSTMSNSLSSVPTSRSASNMSSEQRAEEQARQDASHYATNATTGAAAVRHGSSTPIRSPTGLVEDRPRPSVAMDANTTPSSKQKRQYDAMAGGDQSVQVGRAGHLGTPGGADVAASLSPRSRPSQQPPAHAAHFVDEFGQLAAPNAQHHHHQRQLTAPSDQRPVQTMPHAQAHTPGAHPGYSSDSKRRRGATTGGVAVSAMSANAGTLGSPFDESAMQAHGDGASQLRSTWSPHAGPPRQPEMFYTPSHRPGELQGHPQDVSSMMMVVDDARGESGGGDNATSGNTIGITTTTEGGGESTFSTSPLRPLRLSDLGRSNTSPIVAVSGAEEERASLQRAFARGALGDEGNFFSGGGNGRAGAGDQQGRMQRTRSDVPFSARSGGAEDDDEEEDEVRDRMRQRQLRQVLKNGGGRSQSHAERERERERTSSSASASSLSSSSSSYSSTSLPRRGGSGSTISLDQARESLDIVLQFLNESEEADIIPRSHFLTLGSLHGSLSAAAAAAFMARDRERGSKADKTKYPLRNRRREEDEAGRAVLRSSSRANNTNSHPPAPVGVAGAGVGVGVGVGAGGDSF